MSKNIVMKLKKSSVPGKVPLDTDLVYGELAINYADGKVFFKNSSNTIEYFEKLPEKPLEPGKILSSNGSSLAWIDSEATNIAVIDPEFGDVLEYNPVSSKFENNQPRLGLDIHRCGFVDTSQYYQKTDIFFNGSASSVTSPNSGVTIPPYTFELSDTGEGWSYYRDGKRYNISGNKIVTLPGNPPSAGNYYITIQDTIGNLTVATQVWNLFDYNVIPVAIISFNAALTPVAWLANERHTINIDRYDHYYNHSTSGTLPKTIGSINNYTIGTATDVSITPSIAPSVILDEDIVIDIPELADTNGLSNSYVISYRDGSTWLWKSSPVPFSFASGSFIQWDNNGTLTTGKDRKFYTSYLVLTNTDVGHVFISGQSEFDSLGDAQAENPAMFNWNGFNITEFVVAYKFIWETRSDYNSTGKVVLKVDPILMSLKPGDISAFSSGVSHGSLLGIQGGTTNEHYHLSLPEYTEYQQLYINTSSLSNGNVGIGVEIPEQRLDVGGSIVYSGQLISNVATGTSPIIVSSSTRVSNLNADKAGTADDLLTSNVSINNPTASTPYLVDSIDNTVIHGIKYTITCRQGLLVQMSEVLVLGTGEITEYAIISNNVSLEVTYSTSINSTETQFLVSTPTGAIDLEIMYKKQVFLT